MRTESTLKLPEHIFNFWIHRLTACGFTHWVGNYCSGNDTNCRCAVGTLLPKTNLDKLFTLSHKTNLMWIPSGVEFITATYDAPVSVLFFNDELRVPLKAMADYLTLHQKEDKLKISNEALAALEELYKMAIENGEYVETSTTPT